MGVIKSFLNLFKDEAPQRPVFSIEQFLNSYTDNLDKEPTLLNCLKYRAESMGKMPIKLYLQDSSGINAAVDNNLYYLLFSRPNVNEDATSFWAEVERERLMAGTAYVYIQRNAKGEVTALKRLRKNLMTIPTVFDPFLLNKELAYQYNSEVGTVAMTSEDLLIFRNTTLKNNCIEGESVLVLLSTILQSNRDGNTAIANINKNGIQSTVKVAVDESIDNDRAEEIVENAIGQARGSSSTGVVFQEYGVSITPFTIKLNEADYLNIYKNNQCIILSYFGLSASMLNIEQSTGTYQNSESQMIHYLVNTMLYVIEHYTNELNYKLLTQDQINQGYTFAFDTTGILKVNYETLVSTQANLVMNAITTIDESRNKLGYNNLPFGIGDTAIVNGAYTKLKDLGIAYTDNVMSSTNTIVKGGDSSGESGI